MSTVTTTTTTITTSDLSQETTNGPQLTTREVGAPSPASRAAAAVVPASIAAAAGTTASISGGGGSGESSFLTSSGADGDEFAAESNAEARDNHHHHQGSFSLATYTWQIIIGILGLMVVISLTLMIAALANREPFQPAWATIFLWSSTVLFFVIMLRRHQAQTAAAANEALIRAGVQRGLDKAAWQSLLAYFTFNHSEDEQKGPKGDAAEIEEGITTTNDEGPQGSARHDIMEKGSDRIDSSKWATTGTCIICLGEYTLGDRLCRMPCRHVFHAKCIDEWLDRAKEPCCPMCKNDLRGEESASSSSANTVASEPSGEGVLMDDTAGIEEV